MTELYLAYIMHNVQTQPWCWRVQHWKRSNLFSPALSSSLFIVPQCWTIHLNTLHSLANMQSISQSTATALPHLLKAFLSNFCQNYLLMSLLSLKNTPLYIKHLCLKSSPGSTIRLGHLWGSPKSWQSWTHFLSYLTWWNAFTHRPKCFGQLELISYSETHRINLGLGKSHQCHLTKPIHYLSSNIWKKLQACLYILSLM